MNPRAAAQLRHAAERYIYPSRMRDDDRLLNVHFEPILVQSEHDMSVRTSGNRQQEDSPGGQCLDERTLDRRMIAIFMSESQRPSNISAVAPYEARSRAAMRLRQMQETADGSGTAPPVWCSGNRSS